MTAREATQEDMLYTTRQSQQISMQTGYIGMLSGTVDYYGDELVSSWKTFYPRLKTESFDAEVNIIVYAFRFDKEYGFLKNQCSMRDYCSKHSSTLRVDTDCYSYLVSMDSKNGAFKIMCYKRDYLMSHMNNATKGIKFIDSHYNELFRIKDGDEIRIVETNGIELKRVCRYIDEYHVEIASNLYHICEFAECIEKNGRKVFPA